MINDCCLCKHSADLHDFRGIARCRACPDGICYDDPPQPPEPPRRHRLMVLPNDDVRTDPFYGGWIQRDQELIGVLMEARKELDVQDRRWGEQNHPTVVSDMGDLGISDRDQYARCAAYWKEANAARVARGALAWDGILFEEVYEALEEEDPEKFEAELIQVAAVALNAVTASRRARIDPKEARAALFAKLYAQVPTRWVTGISDVDVRNWEKIKSSDEGLRRWEKITISDEDLRAWHETQEGDLPTPNLTVQDCE